MTRISCKKATKALFCLFFLSLLLIPVARADSILDTFKPAGQRSVLSHPLHGNTESKIFHAFDCEHYNCKTCTQSFSSAREAENRGFRPCSLCKGQEGYFSKASSGKPLHGNPESKIVHGPSCKYYTAKGSTESFSSLEAAKRQGFRLCTICNGK